MSFAGETAGVGPFDGSVGTTDAPARANPLLLLLSAGMAIGLATLGFVSVAPNRILSGRPLPLWEAVGPGWSTLIAGLLLVLGLSALARRGPLRDTLTAAAAALLLLASLAAAGYAAGLAAQAGGALVRTGLGAAFWIVAAGAAFALADAAGRVAPHPAAQAGVALTVGGAVVALALSGALSELSIAREFAVRREVYWSELGRHIGLVLGALAVTLPVGAVLGTLAARRPAAAPALFGGLNLVQTIPSIALFGLLIGPLTGLAAAFPVLRELGISGIGTTPAIIALSLYGLLPVARGVSASLRAVPSEVLDAASGMGMTSAQVLRQVAVPLALPVLFVMLRLVVVQLIGLAVVAALIGAGGLGAFIFQGLGQTAADLVLLGALSAIALALAADLGLRVLAAALTPGGRP